MTLALLAGVLNVVSFHECPAILTVYTQCRYSTSNTYRTVILLTSVNSSFILQVKLSLHFRLAAVCC